MKKLIVMMFLVLGMGNVSSLIAGTEMPDCFPNCGGIQISDFQIGTGMKLVSIAMDQPTTSNANFGKDGVIWYVEGAFQGGPSQIQIQFSKALGDLTKDQDLALEDYLGFNINYNLSTSLDNDLGGLVGLGYHVDYATHTNYNLDLSDAYFAHAIHLQGGFWFNIKDAFKCKVIGWLDYYVKDEALDFVKSGPLHSRIFGLEVGGFYTWGDYSN